MYKPKFTYYEKILVTGLCDPSDNIPYTLVAHFIRFVDSEKRAVVSMGGVQYVFSSWRLKKIDDDT